MIQVLRNTPTDHTLCLKPRCTENPGITESVPAYTKLKLFILGTGRETDRDVAVKRRIPSTLPRSEQKCTIASYKITVIWPLDCTNFVDPLQAIILRRRESLMWQKADRPEMGVLGAPRLGRA